MILFTAEFLFSLEPYYKYAEPVALILPAKYTTFAFFEFIVYYAEKRAFTGVAVLCFCTLWAGDNHAV